MRSLAVGEVVESRYPDIAVGTMLVGWFGWLDYAVALPTDVVRRVVEDDLPLSLSLRILGINGVTAHLALTKIGQAVAGETVLVSTAAGSVGSAGGQIVKLLGCRTVGIAGGPPKSRSASSYSAMTPRSTIARTDWRTQLARPAPTA